MGERTAILIAGPTASGKSALALRLATALGAAIVNADSMQVYRDLAILTARPVPADEDRAPHHLFGTVDGAMNFSVGRYVAAASAVLAELDRTGMPAIFVGGTGLYFKALAEGLSDMPPVPVDIRDRVRAEAGGRPTPDLHAELARVDPHGASRLRPTDRQRILRALEVARATGRPLASFHERRVPGPLARRPRLSIFLETDRDQLRAAIDRRFDAMMAQGALDEVRGLAARRLDPALPVMRAHGVPPLMRYLEGAMSLAEAVARGQADTRAYAKRQVTWFRHQMPDFVGLPADRVFDEVMRRIARGAAVSGDPA